MLNKNLWCLFDGFILVYLAIFFFFDFKPWFWAGKNQRRRKNAVLWFSIYPKKKNKICLIPFNARTKSSKLCQTLQTDTSSDLMSAIEMMVDAFYFGFSLLRFPSCHHHQHGFKYNRVYLWTWTWSNWHWNPIHIFAFGLLCAIINMYYVNIVSRKRAYT